MNKLPVGWGEVKIEDVAKVDSGQGAPQGEKWFNGTEIFVRAGDLNKLTNEKFVGDFCEKITREAIKKYSLKLYPANSVVFPKSGMSVKTDNIALLKYNSYVVNHLAIIQANNIVDAEFIFFVLKRLKISNLSKNPSYPSIRISDISKFKMLWPKENIRKKIIYILEKAEKAKEWRKESDELSKDYLKSVFVDMFGDPVINKKKWEKVPTINVTDSIVPGRDKPKSFTGKTPWITTDDLNHLWKTKQSNKNYGLTKGEINQVNARIIPKDAVIMTCVGDLGIVSMTDAEIVMNQQLHAFVCSKKINPIFLMYNLSFQTSYMYKMATTTTVPYMNKTTCNNTPTILPPLPLQEKFAKIVEQVEQLKLKQKQSKEQLDNLYNALMQKAFKGELIF